MAVYFESAAVITVLVLLGQVLELRAREATSGAIKALLRLAPKTARRIGTDGHEHEVEIASLAAGDQLRVRPGEKVPVDGVILEGRSSLDESLVTGESMPVTKEAGARVIAGTLNQSGSFVMQHSGIMAPGVMEIAIVISPGSGSSELAGIKGTLEIRIDGKQHVYTLRYELPG